MSFIADKQTLDDLNLLGKFKAGSVFHLFNRVQTGGGEKLLESMFREPLQDPAAINKRSALLQYFQQKPVTFPVNKEDVKAMELYLTSAGNSSTLSALAGTARIKVLHLMGVQQQYQQLVSGLKATLKVLNDLSGFLLTLHTQDPQHPFMEQVTQAKQVLQHPQLSWLSGNRSCATVGIMATGQVRSYFTPYLARRHEDDTEDPL